MGGRRRIEDKTGGKHEKGYREKGDSFTVKLPERG